MGIVSGNSRADTAAQQAAESAAHELWPVVAAVPDPEMPPLTIADLGILRSVATEPGEGDDESKVVVTITPTYSGCPAVEYIEDLIVEAVAATGLDRHRIEIRRELSPAWSTDWITDEGREKLQLSGISPPRTLIEGTPVRLGTIACPQCGSSNTSEISRFGATACKALYRCGDCAEPFDHVKEL